ncbi:NEL-type E3 ubiquitin ligase domain-containing protein [Pseudomonas sp. R1-6]|uniref:NEL-type E3 ubiquitin ligase domain-containing protein n=1 Tax=Pseudomonas sp. R1-6 TaxID=2817397 RepID=UPI003DA8C948
MPVNSTHHPQKTIQPKPRATESLHADFLETAMPAWLIEASPQRRQALKKAATQTPAWYANASPEQRKALHACFKASVAAQIQLDKTMSSYQDIDTFARPLLVQALKDQFEIEVDVDKTWLCIRRAMHMGVSKVELSTFDLLVLPLLQLALHNFESWECDTGAYHESSGFFVETATPGTHAPVALKLSVSQFLSLCRTLDIGAKYQVYLKSFFYPADGETEDTLRQHFIASQKTAMRAAAEQALLNRDIEPGDHAMILSVIEGENNPWLGKKPVWFEDMTLMRQRLVGCVAFSICEMHRYSDEVILYVPNDPHHPLKRYRGDELKTRFKQLLTTPETGQPPGTGPTPYQRFFSQFVPYEKRPYFFSQFVREAADSPIDSLRTLDQAVHESPWAILLGSGKVFLSLTRIDEFPPRRSGTEREPDPYLAPSTVGQKGRALWAENLDLWEYLFNQHREKVLADARSHAVPTNDVDAKAREAKLAHLLELGLFAVNIVSMFVPVLGEVMMVVMAEQLLYETLEGAVEWGEGDKRAAKAHLIDVAQNLAMLGVMAGAGAGMRKLAAIKAEPVIERLEPVTLPNGETRLWKPDLGSYESDVTLDDSHVPNTLGQYEIDAKTYIRNGDKVYEQFFDASIRKWRIKHPTDDAAYQPILMHNGTGAWRHSLERPMTWDRLTLLRRMGHQTAAFTDEELLRLADVSGVSDNRLRKMHMDLTPPPPELKDAMRLYKADADAGRMGLLQEAATSGPSTGALGDYAQMSRPQIFEHRYKGPDPMDGRVRILQRECPGLSEAAAQEVIAHGSSADLARIDATRRTPLSMLEEARWYARQGRQVRAYAGLRSENIASADSQRLALRALEKLPGWPGVLRLEVREGGVGGALLDSIGAETAPQKKYLIKNGPRYQAFDEQQGRVPDPDGNFYSSIMRALPEELLCAMGLSGADQGTLLQRKLIEYADRHPKEMTSQLEPHARRFKPPVRVSATLKGYYASGRGAGLNPSIEARVQALYPDAQQAAAFLRQQRGNTDQQIYSVLQTRQREWQALSDTLDQWHGAAAHSTDGFHRNQFAQALRDAWRDLPVAQESGEAMPLSLFSEAPLPEITADFPHVRDLTIVGNGLTDANADGFLARFPGVTRLSIGSRGREFLGSIVEPAQHLTTLPQAVGQMRGLTYLRFSSAAQSLAADFPTRLSALTSLEELHIHYSGFDSASLHELDLTPLHLLRTLSIDAPQALSRWPAYVQDLPFLRRLDLGRTSIHTVPEAMFQGHEMLWSGLSLNWSDLTPEAFGRAYGYVSRYTGEWGHLVDLDQMVDGYCRGQLRRLVGEAELSGRLPEPLDSAFHNHQERFDAMEAIRAQHDAIFAQFYEPGEPGQLPYATLSRRWWDGAGPVFRALRDSWRGAVRQRLGLPTAEVSTFEVSPSGSSLANGVMESLPVLPAGSFAHVRTLRLGSLNVPAAQARGFFQAFSGTRALDISGNGFTALPFIAEDLPALTQLDMRDNGLIVTPDVQAQFNGLQTLEQLNLENNPLDNLDVSAMGQLRTLNLRATRLQAWPTGAESLPHLTWLDLRDSLLRSLPPSALANDEVLLSVNLTGNPLSPEGEAALVAAQQRVENARGLPHGALARFAGETVPSQFPPPETGWSTAQRLLSLPEQSAVPEGDAGRQLRLQRLDPLLTQEQAASRLERWRNEGMTGLQMDARITQWHQATISLIRRLNGWLFVREVNTARGIVPARSRALAAARIRGVWQEGLMRVEGRGLGLSLRDLQVGDLPELVEQFPGVRTLDLSGVLLTEQGSNAFLGAFPRLNRLDLGSNDLRAVPDAVLQMDRLEHLGLGYNNLPSASAYPLLTNGRLRSLNLSTNGLTTFDPPDFGQIESLELSYNEMRVWPGRLLDAQALHILNVSGNEFSDLPAGLLDGSHDTLVGGMDLSENEYLSLPAFYAIRDYFERAGDDEVLGFSEDEIDSWIAALEAPQDDMANFDDDPDGGAGAGAGAHHDPHAGVAPVEPLLDPSHDTSTDALEPWLADSSDEQAMARRTIWAQLAQENDHERFFQLLDRLRTTIDFRRGRTGLTQRVWNVLEAASENRELRQLLFQNAETHGTCIDGRILTFSELEVRVFVHQALRNLSPDRLTPRGQALLRLSRQLFRLDRLDTLAEANGQGMDRAEVRLRYRIGLTRGWGDGIDLPGQPAHMAYGVAITDAQLEQARASILEAERTDELLIDMVSREYWTTYLQARYPEQMSDIDEAVANGRDELFNELEDRRNNGDVDGQQYDQEVIALGRKFDAMRKQKLVELTRTTVNDLQGTAAETQLSDRQSPQPGPSRRD